jgi:hypothetical protein
VPAKAQTVADDAVTLDQLVGIVEGASRCSSSATPASGGMPKAGPNDARRVYAIATGATSDLPGSASPLVFLSIFPLAFATVLASRRSCGTRRNR